MSNQEPRLPTATVSQDSLKAGRKPYRRRLSNYLLDKGLQLRYIGFVTVLSALVSASLGYMIWQQEDQASAQIIDSVDTLCEGMSVQECAEYKEELGSDLHRRDNNLALQMTGVGIGLVIVLGLYLLVMTHKVAGPLYKASMYFDRMAEGRLGQVCPLRKGDMLQDFYDKFQDVHDAVRSRHQRDNELLARFMEACDRAGVARSGELGAARDRVEQHHKDRFDALA